ncbi:21647_t:CDS:2 [Rhizophagus irregularis]|nr:21647_t:CDS:2 [Rhizophagus irregularis]
MSNKIHEFVKNESLAELAKFLNKNSKENKDELIFDPKEPEMEAIDAKKSGMAKVPEKLWQCINNLPAEIDKGRRKVRRWGSEYIKLVSMPLQEGKEITLSVFERRKTMAEEYAVALYGAALQAAILLENTTEKIKDILLHDVNAFNIVTSGDVITPFIDQPIFIHPETLRKRKIRENETHNQRERRCARDVYKSLQNITPIRFHFGKRAA